MGLAIHVIRFLSVSVLVPSFLLSILVQPATYSKASPRVSLGISNWRDMQAAAADDAMVIAAPPSRAGPLPSDEASPRGPGAVDVAFPGEALAARERRSPPAFHAPTPARVPLPPRGVWQRQGGSGGEGSGVLEQSRRRGPPPLRQCATLAHQLGLTRSDHRPPGP